jgi:hypothetical protein
MPGSLASLPRPVPFALTGAAAGLLVALTFGELTWHLVRPAPPAPEPRGAASVARLAVSASPGASVYCGGRTTIRVRLARDGFDGPVTLKLTSPERGLSAAEVRVPAGDLDGVLQVVAAGDAKPGRYAVTVTAASLGQTLSASAEAEVSVVAVPASPRRLAVSVSPKVPVHQHGKNRFGVFVVRGDFDGPVTVRFDGLPAGVAAPAVTIPAGKGEATAELSASDDAKPGSHGFSGVARAADAGVEAESHGAVEVLPSVKLPADVVFALDCTGSMKSTVAGLREALPRFAAELAKARLEARFGLVGFKDTTLGQPLKIVRVGGEKLTADLAGFREAVGELRLGGGGGEGESSLDGIAEAADYRFRDGAVRAVVLVTDGPPKRIDGRASGMEDAVRHLRERKVDQLQVVALPEHRRLFEPLSVSFKGRFLDLKAARELGDFEALAVVLAKSIAAAAPEVPSGQAEPARPAPQPALPPLGPAKLPALPAGAEPDDPRLEKSAPAPSWEEAPVSGAAAESEGAGLARAAWAAVVAVPVALAVLAAQLILMPGERPTVRSGAACSGVALLVGALAGVLAALALGSLAGPVAARLGSATLFGLVFGLTIPLAERVFRRPELLELPPDESELELLPAAPLPVSVKPNITPPRAADGCPGCARVIPGAPGARYCMLCDGTF